MAISWAAMQKVIQRTTLKAVAQDRAYWLTRTVQERIAAVEVLRQQALAANVDVEQGPRPTPPRS